MDLEQQALDYIRRYVLYGFYTPAGVERIVGEDVLSGAMPWKRLRALVKAEFARQRAEAEHWPAVTDCDRLDQVFGALSRAGILSLHNAGMTQSECLTEVREWYREAGGEESGIAGYCFYHRQDLDHVLETGDLYLSFGDTDGDDSRGTQRSGSGSAWRFRQKGSMSTGQARSGTSWWSGSSTG